MQQVLAIAVVCACAPVRNAPVASDPIDAIASQALAQGEAVGIAIAVAHGDNVDARAYGFADREHKVAMSPHSIVPLGSLSKQLWAASAVTQPGFDLDAKLSVALPGFPDNGTRVRDVFQQTSGLGDDHAGEDDDHFTDLPAPAFPPGTSWMYSNRGALIARRLAGPISRFGLESTTVCGDHVQLYEHGKPSRGVPDETWQRVQFVCSNALDVARFERMLDAPEYALLRKPAVIDGLGELPYGLLTRIVDLDGHKAYGHTGAFEGVSVAAFRFPAEDLTIVVLMNASTKPGFHAADLVERIARFELRMPAQAPDLPPPPELLAAIVGEYATPEARGKIEVRGGRAYATIHAGTHVIYEGPLAWRGGRVFEGGGQRNLFLPATGQARAVAAGSTFMLEALAHRVQPSDP